MSTPLTLIDFSLTELSCDEQKFQSGAYKTSQDDQHCSELNESRTFAIAQAPRVASKSLVISHGSCLSDILCSRREWTKLECIYSLRHRLEFQVQPLINVIVTLIASLCGDCVRHIMRRPCAHRAALSTYLEEWRSQLTTTSSSCCCAHPDTPFDGPAVTVAEVSVLVFLYRHKHKSAYHLISFPSTVTLFLFEYSCLLTPGSILTSVF
jgi:hypothetical protein